MFVYTVYPRTPSTGKKASRRVELVSRVRSVQPVEPIRTVQYDDTVPQRVQGPYEAINAQYGADAEAGTAYGYPNDSKRNIRERPVSESYMEDMFPGILPLLVAWRHPRTSAGSGFIQERLECLHAIRSKRGRHNRIKQ